MLETETKKIDYEVIRDLRHKKRYYEANKLLKEYYREKAQAKAKIKREFKLRDQRCYNHINKLKK